MTFGMVATRASGYLLDFLDEAAAAGARMIAQTHCRGISVLLSLKTRLPFDLLPAWHDLRRAPLDEQLADPRRSRAAAARYVDAAVTRRLREVERGRGPGPAAGLRRHPGLPSTACPPTPRWPTSPGPRGVHPAEAMIDLCVESGGDQLFIQPSRYPQDEEVLLRALRHPRAVMTFSDSGAHLSQIADSSIHTHLLGTGCGTARSSPWRRRSG